MLSFKFLIPDHLIFRPRSFFTNAYVSLWSDAISVEEGWGSQGNEIDYGKNFGVANLTKRVCRPDLINGKIKKFNKP